MTSPTNRAITYNQCAACGAKSVQRLDEFDEETTPCPVCGAVRWRDPLDMLADEEHGEDWMPTLAPAPRATEPEPAEPSRAWKFSGWTIAWIVWIALFLVIETAALIRKGPADTASEQWWALFRVRSKVPAPVRALLLVAQLGFGTWLVGHLAFGIWTL